MSYRWRHLVGVRAPMMEVQNKHGHASGNSNNTHACCKVNSYMIQKLMISHNDRNNEITNTVIVKNTNE